MNFKNYKTKDWVLLWLMFAIPTAVTGWGIVVWTIFIICSANSNKQKKELQQIPLRQRQSVIDMNNNLSLDESIYLSGAPGWLKVGVNSRNEIQFMNFTNEKQGYVASKDYVFKYCRCRECGKVIKYCHWYDGCASFEPRISQDSEYKSYFCQDCSKKVFVSDIANKIGVEEIELEDILRDGFEKFQTTSIDDMFDQIYYYQNLYESKYKNKYGGYNDFKEILYQNNLDEKTEYNYFTKKDEAVNFKYEYEEFDKMQNKWIKKNPWVTWVEGVWGWTNHWAVQIKSPTTDTFHERIDNFLEKLKPDTTDPIGLILRDRYRKEGEPSKYGFKRTEYKLKYKKVPIKSDAEIRQEKLENGLI